MWVKITLFFLQSIRYGWVQRLPWDSLTSLAGMDGWESVASNYTELEMTTYDPVLRQNVKLVSICVPKPGENSENVKLMVDVFDKAVNDALPSVAVEYGIANVDYMGCGLDPESYVGDEGGHFGKDFV